MKSVALQFVFSCIQYLGRKCLKNWKENSVIRYTITKLSINVNTFVLIRMFYLHSMFFLHENKSVISKCLLFVLVTFLLAWLSFKQSKHRYSSEGHRKRRRKKKTNDLQKHISQIKNIKVLLFRSNVFTCISKKKYNQTSDKIQSPSYIEIKHNLSRTEWKRNSVHHLTQQYKEKQQWTEIFAQQALFKIQSQ